MAEEIGARNVRLFGSVLRGEDEETSDIDFLVTLDDRVSLLDLIGLEQALEDLLHNRVDIVSDRAISPYIRDRVLAEAKPL